MLLLYLNQSTEGKYIEENKQNTLLLP